MTTNTSRLLPTTVASDGPAGANATETYFVASSAQRVVSYERATTQVMVFTQPPPKSVRTRERFNVSLHLATETGIPLPAQQVQGVLLASFGSGARLARGTTGYTDEHGDVTIQLSLDSGETGDLG